jgi:hypothetical protein
MMTMGSYCKQERFFDRFMNWLRVRRIAEITFATSSIFRVAA